MPFLGPPVVRRPTLAPAASGGGNPRCGAIGTVVAFGADLSREGTRILRRLRRLRMTGEGDAIPMPRVVRGPTLAPAASAGGKPGCDAIGTVVACGADLSREGTDDSSPAAPAQNDRGGGCDSEDPELCGGRHLHLLQVQVGSLDATQPCPQSHLGLISQGRVRVKSIDNVTERRLIPQLIMLPKRLLLGGTKRPRTAFGGHPAAFPAWHWGGG